MKRLLTTSARYFGAAGLLVWLLGSAVGQAQTSSYTIHVDDQLQVLVFGTQGVNSMPVQGQAVPNTIPALSQTVTVLSDGTITYPLIGSISVAGLHPTDAASRIAAALAVYVKHPTVSVLVLKGTPWRVEVLGSVEHGGQFELQTGDRLVDALVKAGVGPSTFADLNHITINRVVDGVPQLYNVNAYNMLLNADYSANPLLEPGDVVYVPKARQHDLSPLASIPFSLYYLYLLAVPSAAATVVR